ncbi:MAG: hypothetical protein IJB00_08495 [Akkermansia sp.]|nr:hypothetical protein [Akkermansia sp.]
MCGRGSCNRTADYRHSADNTQGFKLKVSLYIIVFVLTMSGLICHFLEEVFILDASTAAACAIPVSQLLSAIVAVHAVFLPWKKRVYAALISLCGFIIGSVAIYAASYWYSLPLLPVRGGGGCGR